VPSYAASIVESDVLSYTIGDYGKLVALTTKTISLKQSRRCLVGIILSLHIGHPVWDSLLVGILILGLKDSLKCWRLPCCVLGIVPIGLPTSPVPLTHPIRRWNFSFIGYSPFILSGHGLARFFFGGFSDQGGFVKRPNLWPVVSL